MNQNIIFAITRSTAAQRCGSYTKKRTRIGGQHQHSSNEQPPWTQLQRREYSVDALPAVGAELEASDGQRKGRVLKAFDNPEKNDRPIIGRRVQAEHKFVDFSKAINKYRALLGLSSDEPHLRDVGATTVDETDPDGTTGQELLNVDYSTALALALARQEPDLAARCIFAAHRAKDTSFLQSIKASDYSRVLELSAPTNLLREFLDIHQYLKNAAVNNLGLMPVEEVAKEVQVLMKSLMDIRRDSGAKLSMTDYETILGAAKDLRLSGLAKRAWFYLHADGLEPSVKCFNNFIGAKMRITPPSATARHHDRVLSYGLKWRQADELRTTVFDFRTGVDGIASEGDRMFTEMKEFGIEPDEESFCNLIEAYALEGHLHSVAAILKNVWSIDVRELMESGSDEVQRPRHLSKESPLYPTKRLLSIIVRAYCINNDLPTALKMMDHISRHYEVPVALDQWRLLLEWAHVLSKPRSAGEQKGDRVKGQLDRHAVQNIWSMMTSSPYNAKPTMEMTDFLIRSLRYQENTVEELIKAMEYGRSLFAVEIRRRTESWEHFEALSRERDTTSTDAEASIEHASREWEMSKLRCSRDFELLRSWLHFFTSISEEVVRWYDQDASYCTIKVPELLGQWRRYAPRVVSYYTTTGHVEILLRSREESQQHKSVQMERTAHRARTMSSAERLIDASWYTNFDAADRARANDWSHNRAETERLHKRDNGLRRPEDLFSWRQAEDAVTK